MTLTCVCFVAHTVTAAICWGSIHLIVLLSICPHHDDNLEEEEVEEEEDKVDEDDEEDEEDGKTRRTMRTRRPRRMRRTRGARRTRRWHAKIHSSPEIFSGKTFRRSLNCPAGCKKEIILFRTIDTCLQLLLLFLNCNQ